MKQAKRPFQFVAATYLIQIRPELAWTLAEFSRHLSNVPEACIFYHTFQSLEAHHYTSFSNDFAQWANASCNESLLAEELGAIDVRDFVSVQDARASVISVLEEYLKKYPQSADRPAFEPFHFCESIEVVIPLGTQAFTLGELADGIHRISLHTLHYHFISSRLRLLLQTNDFSKWIEDCLEYPDLAKRLNRIDFYMNTLDEIRKEILQVLSQWNP